MDANGRSRSLIVRFIAAAVTDAGLSISPIHGLIADYARFVGMFSPSVRVRFIVVFFCKPLGHRRIVLLADMKNFCGIAYDETDGSLTLTELNSCRIFRFDNATGLYGLASADFSHPRRICADPSKTSWHYVADFYGVRLIDGSTVAGGTKAGYADGIGTAARFNGCNNCKCSADGKTLFTIDYYNNRLRSIDIKTRLVRTIAGDGEDRNRNGVGLLSSISLPSDLVIYRSPTVAPDSVLFITAHDHNIRRFDIRTGELSSLTPVSSDPTAFFLPMTIACTDAGILIFDCLSSGRLYGIDPATAIVELLSDTGRCSDTCVSGSELLIVSDKRIETMTLPPQFCLPAQQICP